MVKGSNIPTKPGFYFARQDDVKWFHLIVKVYGEHPAYLRARAWDLKEERLVSIEWPEDLHWGSEIKAPDDLTHKLEELAPQHIRVE